MASRVFWTHGKLCATHPWEVIIATLTLTTCLLTCDYQPPHSHQKIDLIAMILIRSLAVVYTYHQFKSIYKLDSKHILWAAVLFVVCSNLLFTSLLMMVNVSDLHDGVFLHLLLTDLTKSSLLVQFTCSATKREKPERKIAQGLSLLAPTITLDTIATTLVISIGLVSGVPELQVYSTFACLAILVNYMVFMTIFPACLSLISLQVVCATCRVNFPENDCNPVVQRIKLIMSVACVLVHTHTWLGYKKDVEGAFKFNLELTIVLIFALAFIIKCLVFEGKYELKQEDQIEFAQNKRTKDVQTASTRILVGDDANKNYYKSVQNQASPTTNQNEDCKDVRKNFNNTTCRSFEECFIASQNEDLKNVHKNFNNTTCKSFEEYFIASQNEDCKDIHKNFKNTTCRSFEECFMDNQTNFCSNDLTDEEVILLVENKTIAVYEIEKFVSSFERGVEIRRKLLNLQDLLDLPYKCYDYSKIIGVNCENLIGYIPIPLGVAGPLNLDDQLIYVPMATTEGCLVASTNRGCRALLQSGVKSNLIADGMTRGPVVRFWSSNRASQVLIWLEQPENFAKIKASFDSTSNYARLIKLNSRIAGRLVFIRFVATTGDAMGMNMLCKGSEAALTTMRQYFPDLEIVSLSGNFCTDKKPSALNWLEGRGKSVVCEAVVPKEIVTTILKTTPEKLIDVNTTKNLIGSAMAATLGGNNAHAANIVTAIFIATGQDPAQNVVSSNCMTLMEPRGEDVYVSCTMPSIEVGTVGGGTGLAAQAACLEMLGVKGANVIQPGANSAKLARIVCGAVLAGELSLLAALATGDLVKSHLRHNRCS